MRIASWRCLTFVLAVSWAASAVATDLEFEKASITAAVESYTAAFNAGDADALAAHWGPEAVYTNPITGSQVEGREAIASEFKATLEHFDGTKLSVKVESIEFVSPSVAVERGSANLIRADEEPVVSQYTAIHVKRDGKWLLDRVSEEDAPVVLSHYEQLKELEWMIGSWVDEDDQGSVRTTCEWTKNKNFITRAFTVSVADRIEMSGMQLIGWDESAKRIRSWVFDSDGGFAEGFWTTKSDQWHIANSGVSSDGLKTSSVNIITRMGDDQFKWRSINRVVAGDLLPNIDEVVVVRQTETP